MKRRKHILMIILIVFFVSLSLWNIFAVSREAWFDSSFTLQTVYKLRTEGYSSVDFPHFDVHSPAYYTALYGWSFLNPKYLSSPSQGISEYHWSQLFSMVWGIIFFIFIFLALSKVFGWKGEIATLLLAACTTYVHYFTEPRMYCMVLAMSAIVFYAMIQKFEGKWFWVALVALVLLPFLHYFASMAVFVYVFIGFFILWSYGVSKKEALSRVVGLFAFGMLSIMFVFVKYALPQKERVLGTWFQSPSIMSWPSAAFYSMFMTEAFEPNLFITFTYLFMLIVFVYNFYKMWKTAEVLVEEKKLSGKETVRLMMRLVVFLPAMGLIGAPLLGGDGFAHLYHHRFFLVVMWMFAAVVFIDMLELISKERLKKLLMPGLSVIGVVLIFMLYLYGVNAHHELNNLIMNTPCEEVNIVHESPFSALPYMVYGREYDCPWNNYVSTNFSEEMLNGGGGDAMDEGSILYHRALPERGDYYYVYAAGTVPIDGIAQVVVEEDGVELWYIMRDPVMHPKEEGWEYTTAWNNETQETEINWYRSVDVEVTFE